MSDEKKQNVAMLLDTVDDKIQQAVVIKAEPPNNWSTRKISEWLSDNHGIDCSHVSVGKWLERRKVAIIKSVYGDKNFLKSVQRDYGLLLDRYVKSVLLLTEMQVQVERSRDDIQIKTECATKLQTSIRESVLVAKEIIVGNTSVENAVQDIEKDIEEAAKGIPDLVIKKEVKESMK